MKSNQTLLPGGTVQYSLSLLPLLGLVGKKGVTVRDRGMYFGNQRRAVMHLHSESDSNVGTKWRHCRIAVASVCLTGLVAAVVIQSASEPGPRRIAALAWSNAYDDGSGNFRDSYCAEHMC